MSVGREASLSAWITGYLGGAFFLRSASSARRTFSFAFAVASLERLSCPSPPSVQRRLALRTCDLLVLGRDRGLGLVIGIDLLLRHRGHLEVVGAGEDALERVVIGGGDRVVLVVVAAGAGDRQAEEAASQGIDAVGVLVELVAVAVIDRPAGKEAQGRQAVEALGFGTVEPVAGNLLEDESVIGHVAVEGPDQPVAIAEPVRVEPGLERVGLVLAVTGHVEPVTAPALAIVGRGQQPIDQPIVGVGGIVVDKGRDLLGTRRQPDQVERDPADQGGLVRRRRW